jgi:regulator of RNase E activity RraA
MIAESDRSLLKRLVGISTGNACDALTEIGRIPTVMRGVRSVGASSAFAGPAFPLRQVPRPIDASPTGNLTKHIQVFDELAQPGQVIVIDTGARDEVCTFGSILILRAKLRGIAGVVTDGCVRDLDEIPKVGLPVHAKGSNPIASKVFFQTVSIGEPVSCGGVQVRPNDVIFGDATGVVVITPALLAEVVERAERISGKESKWIDGIKAGKTLAQSQRDA